MSFQGDRIGQAKTSEVVEYYEIWLEQAKARVEKKRAEIEAGKKMEAEWVIAHPIRSKFYQKPFTDQFDGFTIGWFKEHVKEINIAYQEALYNARNGIAMTRVHMDFFKIDE
jgi:sRNA-binding protein